MANLCGSKPLSNLQLAARGHVHAGGPNLACHVLCLAVIDQGKVSSRSASFIAGSSRPAFSGGIPLDAVAEDHRVDWCTADKVRMAGMGHQGKPYAELTRYPV